jgi:hypothetical protein
MESMVFNVVRVVGVEPGAELDGTLYDQWVRIDHRGSLFSVFDQMLIMPEHASGELHEVKLSFMATSVIPSNRSYSGTSGNRFSGKVVSVFEHDSYFDHIIDVDGLKVHLPKNERHPLGEQLEIKGRLDLDDIQYPSPTVWEPASFD